MTPSAARKLKSALVEAVGHASVWAANGPLWNRVKGRGRPPDNAVFIFIDDIVRACEAAGLKPGLRYVAGTESLPVHVYKKLAPLLWPGSAKAPRHLYASDGSASAGPLFAARFRLFSVYQQIRLTGIRCIYWAPGRS